MHKNKTTSVQLSLLLFVFKFACFITKFQAIGLMSRVFINGPGDRSSIPGRVILKTDTILLNTQHYKVWIKGKVEQSSEKSNALPYTLV